MISRWEKGSQKKNQKKNQLCHLIPPVPPTPADPGDRRLYSHYNVHVHSHMTQPRDRTGHLQICWAGTERKRSNVKTTQTKVDPRASLSPSESPGWESLWGLSRTGPCSSRWKRGREQEEEEEEGQLVMKKDTKVFRDLDDWRPEGSNKRKTPYMGEFSTSLCCLYDMLLKMWKIILVFLRECKMSYVYTVSFFFNPCK